jgi:hypothetical protein
MTAIIKTITLGIIIQALCAPKVYAVDETDAMKRLAVTPATFSYVNCARNWERITEADMNEAAQQTRRGKELVGLIAAKAVEKCESYRKSLQDVVDKVPNKSAKWKKDYMNMVLATALQQAAVTGTQVLFKAVEQSPDVKPAGPR